MHNNTLCMGVSCSVLRTVLYYEPFLRARVRAWSVGVGGGSFACLSLYYM